ncbi:MAG: hypothetical protein V9G19_04705 [Tetrasphaera sp.]
MSEYRWRCLGPDQEPVAGAPEPAFPTQADAEAWLGESWEELADAGVSAVTLLDHDTVVYGPMSLEPQA